MSRRTRLGSAGNDTDLQPSEFVPPVGTPYEPGDTVTPPRPYGPEGRDAYRA